MKPIVQRQRPALLQCTASEVLPRVKVECGLGDGTCQVSSFEPSLPRPELVRGNSKLPSHVRSSPDERSSVSGGSLLEARLGCFR